METLSEYVKRKFGVFGRAYELVNGNVVGAYGNGFFQEYQDIPQETVIFRYQKTSANVKKMQWPWYSYEMFITLNWCQGEAVHNKSFCFTDYGILSFITNEIVMPPFKENPYDNARCEDGVTVFIVGNIKYHFDGVKFTVE